MKTEKQAEGEKRVGQHLHVLIGEQVMHGLGQPSGLQRVQVRKLWDDRFRVNIYIGPDTTSAVVAHSFFLVADDQGNITSATPIIKKQY